MHALDLNNFLTLTPTSDFDSTLASILNYEPSDADAEELVDWVDSQSNKVKTLPRSMIHKYNALHSGAGILPVKFEHIYCHQRSANKRIFPSMLDMFVGGVSESGEPSRTTALREMAEELNLQAPSPTSLSPKLFTTTITTSYNRCIVDCYKYDIDPSEAEDIVLQESEVQWGGFIKSSFIKTAITSPPSDPTIIQKLKDLNVPTPINEWVPDGLLVWEAWTSFENNNK